MAEKDKKDSKRDKPMTREEDAERRRDHRCDHKGSKDAP